MSKKRSKAKRSLSAKSFLEPLIALPYAFWGIYVFENGLNALSIILGLVLLVIIPGITAAFWRKV